MFPTGASVGFNANIFGPGYLPKFIPSFSWLDNAKSNQTYQLPKAIQVARRVMARRNVKFGSVDKKIFEHIFKNFHS